ncbi:MAG: S8 family peptidase [Flavitalea sp.]
MLESLQADSAVLFIDLLRKPKEELITGNIDLSLNKLNMVHHLFPGINGHNINVSLKEQRFDTTDIDLKGRYFNSRLAAPTHSDHASIMATMLGGAGNSSYFSLGAARGVNLTSSDFAYLMPDDPESYETYNISIQNHSYGTGIENYYSADASAYDASALLMPTLLHVFSSGNSGQETSEEGNYAGIPRRANITGSFKMAKNIITVGAADEHNKIMEQSSKGPAYDGRIKPELVAFGQDGSSGSAALVSGAAALLQQAYQDRHGRLPSSGLVKAILLNSADPVDSTHISYSTGFGSLNALKAVESLNSNSYFESSVRKNQSSFFSLNIPSGIAQCKVMLVWNDPPAETNAAKALVNDLDIKLSLFSAAQSWLPWVLNHSPEIDSLQLPPSRKVDTLNNIEQITIDNPQPGIYTLEVRGYKMISETQSFAISYLIDTTTYFRWTFPSSEDVISADELNVLRWESNSNADSRIEYAINGGSWQPLSQHSATRDNYFDWIAPDTQCLARLRAVIPSLNIISESEEFIISPPVEVKVGFNCADSLMLFWNGKKNNLYQVYRLGANYLEPLAVSSDTFFIIKKDPGLALEFAVAPVLGIKTGLRSNSIDYSTQGVSCYFQNFYATLLNLHTANLELSLGSVYGVNRIDFQKKYAEGFRSVHSVDHPSEVAASFIDASLTKGVNYYRASVTFSNGLSVYSPVETILYFPAQPVIAFPNPVRQSQPFTLIAQEPGIYSFVIYTLNGKIFHRGTLNDIKQQISGISFPAGVYLLKYFSQQGNSFIQNLVVY